MFLGDPTHRPLLQVIKEYYIQSLSQKSYIAFYSYEMIVIHKRYSNTLKFQIYLRQYINIRGRDGIFFGVKLNYFLIVQISPNAQIKGRVKMCKEVTILQRDVSS